MSTVCRGRVCKWWGFSSRGWGCCHKDAWEAHGFTSADGQVALLYPKEYMNLKGSCTFCRRANDGTLDSILGL